MQPPIVSELGNSFTFHWVEQHIWIRVERVYQHRRGEISGEITIRSTMTEPSSLLHHSMVANLLGIRSRSPIAKDCHEKYPLIDQVQWLSLIETTLEHVITKAREGDPPEYIVDVELVDEDEYLHYPLLHEGHITVLFGLGGTLKSTLSAYLANQVALGTNGNGANVCILDWESSKSDWAKRLKEVAIGMGDVNPAPNITYRRMFQPIADDIESVYRIGAERDIGFWILDSAMWACGGRPEEAEYAMTMFRAIRSLGGTTLIIAHQNGEETTKRPYGNVMWVNAPRSVVQARKSELTVQDNKAVVGLVQRKVNYGHPFKPMGFEATFFKQDDHKHTDGDYVSIASANPLDDEDLAGSANLTQRISHALSRGRMTKKTLYEQLSIASDKEKSASTIIDRMTRANKLERFGEEYALAAGTYSRTQE